MRTEFKSEKPFVIGGVLVGSLASVMAISKPIQVHADDWCHEDTSGVCHDDSCKSSSGGGVNYACSGTNPNHQCVCSSGS